MILNLRLVVDVTDAVLVAPHEAEMYDSMVPELAALSYVMADPQEVAKEGDFSFSCNDEASLADVPVEKGNFTHKECFVCPSVHPYPLPSP